MEKAKIRRLEDENESLQRRLQEKIDEGLKIWERDFYMTVQIDDFLKNKDFGGQSVTKLLSNMKQGLTVPDDFEKPSINKEQLDNLNSQIRKLEAENQLVESKHTMLQTDYQKKTREIDNLTQKIKELELENKDNKMLIESMKTDYQNEKISLLLKLDKVTDEKDLRKHQLKKLKEKENNNDENKGMDQMTILLDKSAKLEGRVRNLEKENRDLWEKMEFYRRISNL